jgi:CRP-like cAMP-binding protein
VHFGGVGPIEQPLLERRNYREGDFASLAEIFADHATLVRLDRGASIHTDLGSSPVSYFVRDGTVALEVPAPRNHIVDFWYPNDILPSSHLAEFPGAGLRATSEAELLRLRASTLDAVLADKPDLARAYLQCSAKAVRKLMLTNAILGGLDGTARVATFVIMCGVRQGAAQAVLAEIRVEHSRNDIADYLGLNADTLSRIIMRLQRDGILETRGRHGIVVRDWPRLRGLSPLTPTGALGPCEASS